MTTSDFANLLAFACFLAALFRARWVALALAPPCLLILARWTGLVDISSASHPLRFRVPILSLSLAMWAAWREVKAPLRPEKRWRFMGTVGVFKWEKEEIVPRRNTRALYASFIVFGSGCTDIPALLTWQLPGEWVLVPLQIMACLGVLVVLLAPERWASRWLR